MTSPSPALGAVLPGERPLVGIGLMAAGVCTLPLMDGTAKYLSAEFHVLQVAWARYGFHGLLLLGLLAWRLRPAELIPRHPGLQIVRSGFLLGTTLCYFGAIAYLPLATVLALAFIGPVASTALAPFALGEQLGPRRWFAVLIGFSGALIVLRPGFDVFHPAALLALGAGVFYGLYLLATRRLSGSGRPAVTLLYTAVIGAAVLTLTLPFVWRTPDATDWLLMAIMGVFGAVAHFLIIRAFEHAPAAVLGPVSYVEIVMAVAVGWIAFGDFPDLWTWTGIAVIVSSGIYISFREGRVRAPLAD